MADGIKSQELIRKKERQLALAAARCFVDKGFHKTTVREIAKNANLTIGNLYDYIRTKEDTLYIMYKEIYWEWTGSLLQDANILSISDPKGQLVASLEKLIDLHDKSRELMTLAYREAKFLQREHLREVLKQETRLVDYFANIIARGVESGAFRKVNPILAANSIILQLALIPLRGWSVLRHCKEDEIKTFVLDFIIAGIVSNAPPNA